MRPIYKYTRERGWCWVCQYGNIITMSKISAEACYSKHIRKLAALYFDIDKIEENIAIINRQERDVERASLSY